VINEKTSRDVHDLLKDMIDNDYNGFVSKLGAGSSDPRVIAAIGTGLQDGVKYDDVSKTEDSIVNVSSLIPTQNEIDITKSLLYPITDKKTATICLDGNEAVIVLPLITFRKKYIIDGHHRWSQVYSINPKATMKSIDLIIGTTDPIKVLKAVQMAIAESEKRLPTANVSGINMLKVDINEIKNFVNEATFNMNLLEMFKEHKIGNTIEEIADTIWNNIKKMQKISQPIKNAPNREVMPQTDQSLNWSKLLKAGVINWNTPY
jgi:hypothetical protein